MRNAGCVLRFKRKIANAKIYEDKRDLYCMCNELGEVKGQDHTNNEQTQSQFHGYALT